MSPAGSGHGLAGLGAGAVAGRARAPACGAAARTGAAADGHQSAGSTTHEHDASTATAHDRDHELDARRRVAARHGQAAGRRSATRTTPSSSCSASSTTRRCRPQGFTSAEPEYRADRGHACRPSRRAARHVPRVPGRLEQLVADTSSTFHSRQDAYLAGQHYALRHGLELLDADAVQRHRRDRGDVRLRARTTFSRSPTCARSLRRSTLGGPPQFQRARTDCRRCEQPTGSPRRRSSRSSSASQYQALDQGDRPGGRRQDHRPQLLERRLRAAGRSRRRVRLGQRRAGGIDRGARRRGPGVRATINHVERAADSARDARAQRGGRPRPAGSRRRSRSSSCRPHGLILPTALDRSGSEV